MHGHVTPAIINIQESLLPCPQTPRILCSRLLSQFPLQESVEQFFTSIISSMPERQIHGIIQYAPLEKITCKELEKRKKRKTNCSLFIF